MFIKIINLKHILTLNLLYETQKEHKKKFYIILRFLCFL